LNKRAVEWYHLNVMKIVFAILLVLFSFRETHADIYKYVTADGTVFFTNTTKNKSGKLVFREKNGTAVVRNRHPVKTALGNTESFHSIAEERARVHNVDSKLVKAVIKTESNWNPTAVSRKGAQGLMQLMPGTATLLGVVNPFDPYENIDGGIRYLKFLLEKFNGNMTLALAAYNAGPKLVERKKAVPSIPETVDYVKRVIAYYTGEDISRVKVNTEEVKRAVSRIRKLVQQDGTILFTNSYFAGSYLENQGIR